MKNFLSTAMKFRSKSSRLIVLLGLCVYLPSAFSESADREVQNKLNSIRSMSANFSQVVKAGKRELSNSEGIMAFSRPARFRWQTKSPLEQLIVADSQNLWVYDIDLDQVTVKKQDKSIGGTPALFLSNYNETVTKDFKVQKNTQNGVETFDLYAKSPKENYQRLKLVFKENRLTQIEFYDQLGQHTVVSLSQIKTNPALKAELFQFKPPKGVDVVKQ